MQTYQISIHLKFLKKVNTAILCIRSIIHNTTGRLKNKTQNKAMKQKD